MTPFRKQSVSKRTFSKLAFGKLAMYSSLGALLSTGALAQQNSILEEIVVTAQRKAESIQDVPVAISAFGAEDMQMRRMDDGRDLQLAVPNLNFTGGNNFQIRGVGDSVGGTTGDVGVGIHHNNAPQVVSRVVSAETYDVERIEVLRGPQGTLYGRNSTGGVINFITAKPQFDENDFSVSAEVGNYNSRKFKAMANVPMGEMFALRLAGMSLSRDGYTDNLATGNDIDDRDLYSMRATLAFEPSDAVDGWLLFETFKEDDSRRSGARSMCITDPGPTQVGDTAVTNPLLQDFLSQGCLPGSIYSDEALGRPHSVGTFGGRFASALSLAGLVPAGNLYEGMTQPKDLRKTSEFMDPETTIEQDIVELEVNFHLTDELTLSFLGHHSEDESYAKSGSYEGDVRFLDTPLTPDGVWTDYQHGASTGMRTLSINDGYAEQTSLEVRLQSDFAGPINFNIGALSYDVERETHTWVSTNTTTLYINASSATYCARFGLPSGCVYFDENPTPDYSGHQYFDTWTPYQLDSQALFTELYFDLSDTLKLTTGLRYTEDEKERLSLTPQLLSPIGANGPGTGGYPESAKRIDEVGFEEYTGRIVLDWMPNVAFSDSTLVYGSFSRGYKAGGFNSPEAGRDTFTPYDPEFVNAFELGTKNTFAGGRTQVNAALFFYDYQDYQISKLEQLSVRNENIDAEVWGLEFETIFNVMDNLALNANLGWLKTEVQNGASVDTLDRTAGDPDFTVLRTYDNGCIAPTSEVEAIVNDFQTGAADAVSVSDLVSGMCAGRSAGIAQDLTGNELPNSPELSAALGLQYNFNVGGWDSALRVDYSWKDDSYVSVFNGENYELESWDNANLSLNMANFDMGLDVQLFVKNVFDDDTVVNYGTASDGVGLTRGVTLLDPRLWGAALTYNF
ncbi:TonB-dependent receptor [Gilvimarinus sp. F26214L]|uniref:TonB-dependent receptor n=1 Tax=Gilvimarinus sp. DZF01 TaxID=3461371 RepID=UPI004045DECE